MGLHGELWAKVGDGMKGKAAYRGNTSVSEMPSRNAPENSRVFPWIDARRLKSAEEAS
jgi:hypothetical protein